ncbi:hypothetical protein [Kitasatospora sp. NPDC017646]|uniref:hypothetical protein n=1 Tax=Kitasatospora sp. NPDC017646 TaxID=3364024 RepID=UPI0037BE1CEF
MTARQLLEIAFSSGRSGSGPATWGQQAIWDAVRRLPPADAPRYDIATAAPLDPGLPLPTLLDALAQLLHLHDSLHTRLLPTPDGRRRQVVDPAGSLTVEVRPVTDDSDPAEAGARLHRELAERPFDTAAQWPVRVGVVTADGLARHIGLVLSRTAVDGSGMNRLAADLSALSLGHSPADLAGLRDPAQPPLAEAEFRTSERGVRRDGAARKQFLRKLRLGPPRLFPRPATPQPIAPQSTAPQPTASEPAARCPLPQRRTALPHPPPRVPTGRRRPPGEHLLCPAGGHRRDDRPPRRHHRGRAQRGRRQPLPTRTDRCGERGRRRGLFHLPDATAESGKVVRRTRAAAIGTHQHAYFDKLALAAEIEQLTAEGVPLADRSCVFNDTRELLPAAPGRADEGTTLSWPVEFDPHPGLTYALDALQSPEALSLAMTADPAVVPHPAMAESLYGIEALILTEASNTSRADQFAG